MNLRAQGPAVAEGGRPPFRGGRMLARDQWYGLEVKEDFLEFRRWWHRTGMFDYGRDYLASKTAADEVYREWAKSAGRERRG